LRAARVHAHVRVAAWNNISGSCSRGRNLLLADGVVGGRTAFDIDRAVLAQRDPGGESFGEEHLDVGERLDLERVARRIEEEHRSGDRRN